MFDTLKYSKILESVGIPRDQAEAHVSIIAEIIEGDLATKQDLERLENRLVLKLGTITVTVVTVAIAIATAISKL